MPKRQAVSTCVVHRDGKQVSVAPGQQFDFTKEEIEQFEKLGAVSTTATVDLSKTEGGEGSGNTGGGAGGGAGSEGPEYLKGNVAQVAEKIKALDDETLKGAAEAEGKGQNRKGVIEAIEAELKERADL